MSSLTAPAIVTPVGAAGAVASSRRIATFSVTIAGEIGKVDAVDGVAVGAAVLGAHVLMLTVVIFGRLGKANGGEAGVEERQVIAAALEAVGAPYGEHPEAMRRGRDPRDRLGQRARRRIVLATDAARRVHVVEARGGADALAEHADRVVDMLAADPVGVVRRCRC